MTNETKHTADARPWHVATHPENNEIKYIRFDNGEFHKEVCVLYSSNSKANAAHILKCVNTRDELVDALTAADVLLAELGHSLPQVKTALKKASE